MRRFGSLEATIGGLNMKKIVAIAALAVILFSCRFEFDARARSVEAEFVPVESIYGIPTGSLPYIAIPLAGTVMPENATYKKIEWSIAEDSELNLPNVQLDGARLTANEEGTVTVTAVIKDGLGEGKDYSQSFSIVISLAGIHAVNSIFGIPTVLPIGDYTLNGTVTPTNTLNTTIIWSIADPGTTGATVYGNDLTIRAKGTLVITATVQGGLLEKGDFTQDFKIFVPRPDVYVAGYLSPGILYNHTPCYWKDGELNMLPVPAGNDSGHATGIVYANGNLYISGYTLSDAAYDRDYNRFTACYWVNGRYIKLSTNTTLGNYADTVFITVDSTTSQVYILGRYREVKSGGAHEDNQQYCYWIVDENGEVTRKDLAPTGTISRNSPIFPAIMAVDNGNVYIPFRPNNNNNYYWDETGAVNQLTVNGSSNWFVVNAVKVWNNKVYFAGRDSEVSVNASMPFYFVKEGSGYTVLSLDKSGITYGYVGSMVEQYGDLVLYGYGYGTDFQYHEWSWNTATNSRTTLPSSYYEYDTSNVAFSDGDVYITTTPIPSPSDSNKAGYMVLAEGETEAHFLSLDNYYNNRIWGIGINGIALKENQGGITVPVASVHLNQNALNLFSGESEELIVTILPSHASTRTVTWVSNNPSVASVAYGLVTAHAAGTATITVTTLDGGHTATCTVTVTVPINHSYGAWTVISAATATTNGSGTRTCTGAGHPDHTDTLPIYATGTSGLAFTLINSNTAYRVNKGSATGAIFIPAYYRANATSEYLPVTHISNGTDSEGNPAFGGANNNNITNVSSLTFAAESRITHIADYAFRRITSLSSVTFPASLTYIGRNAFDSCTGLNTINMASSNVTGIERATFVNCTNLANVTLPASLTFIGLEAFYRCSFTSITLPAGLMSIEELAFSSCTGLSSITIPASVTTIESSNSRNPFNNCTSLTTVIFAPGSQLTTLPTGLFNGCTALTSVTLPEGLTTIEESAFEDCTALASITIPANVTEIDSVAFYYCTNLASVTINGTIPASGLNEWAFNGDLRDKYLAAGGGPGTYIRTGSGETATWAKQ